MEKVVLRDVINEDLEIFFINHQDMEANYMAAFVAKDPTDRQAFNTHWKKLFKDPDIINKTVLYKDKVAGVIAKFVMFGDNEITYWIGRDYWGKGIATEALKIFLTDYKERPLHARAAHDNNGSIRVLEKNGFKKVGKDKGFANARQKEIEEFIFRLD